MRNRYSAISIPLALFMRKDELETAITHFLRTGKVGLPTKRSLTKTGDKDTEIERLLGELHEEKQISFELLQDKTKLVIEALEHEST